MRPRRALRPRWATVALLALLGLSTACGGGGSSSPPRPPGTPAGSYTLNVTATAAGQSRTIQLTLNVN